MRTLLALSTLLPLLAAPLGCDDGGTSGTGHEGLDQSLAVWEDMRDTATDYSYVRYFDAFKGYPYAETEIVVQDGEVVERHWVSLDESGGVIESWDEVGDELGSHEDGDPAVTLDGLYEECVTVFHETGFSRFETFANGLLKDCYDQDDGIYGVRLRVIEIEDNSCAGVTGRPCG